jgi:MFS family permease
MSWMILSLLVAVTTINYLDRLLLSVLSPVLRDYFHFAESTYGNISGAFQIAYAFGYLAFGKLVDRYGTKIGLGVAGGVTGTILLFSVAAAAHQAFSSMAFTMPGDVFPSNAIATVQGLGGFAGSISSVIFSAVLPGYLIPLFGYTPMLIVLSFGYLAAVAVHAGTFRDFKPVEISTVPFAEPIPVR